MTAYGFTGSRHGMTEAQRNIVDLLLSGQVTCVHHGDCVGADAQFHDIAEARGIEIVIHPPVDDRLRAFKQATEYTWAPRPYLERNRDIVDDSDYLIATPAEDVDPGKGGTWYTIRYARDAGKPVVVVLPDGSLQHG